MTSIAPPPAAPARPTLLIGWFLNPYVQIGIGALTVTASEILMKVGANTVPPTAGASGWLGVAALASLWTWAGIVCYILSFLSWIYVLRSVPLGIAYALINVAHVLIPVGSWAFLHEVIGVSRWCGIALVILGLTLLIGPVAKVEEKL